MQADSPPDDPSYNHTEDHSHLDETDLRVRTNYGYVAPHASDREPDWLFVEPCRT
jgi:hypothetical protein